MKIKMKDGGILDLDEYSRSTEAAIETNVGLVSFQRRLAVVEALKAVLSVPSILICSVSESAKADGWDEAIQAVHKAAGVIEEDEDAS